MLRILLLCLLSLLSSPGLLLARDVFFYHNDNVGTPVAMTDSSGKVVWRAHDKPFGEEFQTTATPHNSRRFIGKEKDKETGLVYIGARYLDPASGRFLQPDPVGPVDPMTGKVNVEMLTNPQRLNRYVYGLNNPYRYIDPDGKMSRDIENGINPFEMTEGWAPRGGGGISSGSSGARGSVASKGVSSNSARREVMRQQDIPTSQQPFSQSRNMSGGSYEYEVPKPGGGTQIKSVQQQTMDQSHPGQGHWEAGSVKTDPISGQVRSNQYGRPKLTNDKSKVNYDE